MGAAFSRCFEIDFQLIKPATLWRVVKRARVSYKRVVKKHQKINMETAINNRFDMATNS
jgi:hypothetical protein